MRGYLASIISSAMLIGCSMGRPSEGAVAGLASAVRPTCALGPNENPYFGEVFRGHAANSASATYHGMLLFAMQEPSLACGPGADQSYRVMHLRTFDPVVRMIRIAHDGTRTVVTSVTITQRDGTWPVTSREEKEVSPKDWDEFEKGVQQPGLWSSRVARQASPGYAVSLPAQPLGPTGAGVDPKRQMLDGSTWVLEAHAAGRYDAVLRGGMEPEYAAVVRALWRLAGVELPEELRRPWIQNSSP
jgi:hypothetical protein